MRKRPQFLQRDVSSLFRALFGSKRRSFPNMPRTAMKTRNRITIFDSILASDPKPGERSAAFDLAECVAQDVRAEACQKPPALTIGTEGNVVAK